MRKVIFSGKYTCSLVGRPDQIIYIYCVCIYAIRQTIFELFEDCKSFSLAPFEPGRVR